MDAEIRRQARLDLLTPPEEPVNRKRALEGGLTNRRDSFR
jgi:hypothetical protein